MSMTMTANNSTYHTFLTTEEDTCGNFRTSGTGIKPIQITFFKNRFTGKSKKSIPMRFKYASLD